MIVCKIQFLTKGFTRKKLKTTINRWRVENESTAKLKESKALGPKCFSALRLY
jgi:hypothetical protein